MKVRPTTHCSVPGHGTRCVVARDLDGLRYPRCTEERMALDYEHAADDWQQRIDIAQRARTDGQRARKGKPAEFTTRRRFAVTPPS